MAVGLVVGLGGVTVLPIQSAGAVNPPIPYTATLTAPIPPFSNFSGASPGGAGWSVAVSSTQVFSVFLHSGEVEVGCLNQVDSSNCSGYPKIVSGLNGGFATPGHPGLYLSQSSGRLYVFATQESDNTGGVVCIDTTSSSSNPFCGFTPLTTAGQAPTNPSYSEISDPVQVGSNWYAFNYFYDTNGPGTSVPTGTEDELMCFSLTSFGACDGEPFNLGLGGSTFNMTSPAPLIAAVGGDVIVPINAAGASGTTLLCYDPSVGISCSGTWPVSGPFYASAYGAAFPMLDPSTGAAIGFCLPTGADPCYSLDGSAATTPLSLQSVVGDTTVWNGPATVVGTRVYIADGNLNNEVLCYDWGTGNGCSNFPVTFSNLNFIYSVNPDPDRPTCLWVAGDNGFSSIQNFDTHTGGACGDGPIDVAASSVVAAPAQCAPTQWTSLQVTSPYPPTTYGGGSVEFENSNGVPLSAIGGLNPATLSATGSVDLTGYDFSSVGGVPEFAITLNTPPAGVSSISVEASWQAADSAACLQPGTTASFVATANPGSTTHGNTVTLSASGIPAGATGVVTFSSRATSLCSFDVSTSTSCVTGVLPAGSYPVSGSYSGDSTYAAATATTSFNINFIAVASPGLTTYGTAVTLSESGLDPAATGTVTFATGGTTLCLVILGSSTSCNAGVLQPGVYPVTATYPGDATHSGSVATTAFDVAQGPTSISVSATLTGSLAELAAQGV
ncbi:MAG TPA: Ig-like domain-containing protein, partial [Acidimicrobiales bacterium]|nr:Ig-like domain-containing protein [Acidimicrobiales bacterium]